MVQSVSSFDWNLVKSLLILWMLSILVIIIAIFCSMFLSWPIAVVLTLFILLGHWGVLQLGDALAPGIGNQIATDLGLPTASQNKVVSESVEAMSRLLRTVSQVLPDIEQFSAIERIERGLTIPPDNLLSPLVVLVLFGLPMLVLSYVILRNKEVAP
jgi:ABC-type branched-subunit amino acid transport system permease subunit